MNRTLRKYHRTLAIIICLPLLVTIVSGVLISVVDEWFDNPDLAETIRQFHTMEIIGLERFFPLLNGLALFGLLVTGISMTSLFRKNNARLRSGDHSQ